MVLGLLTITSIPTVIGVCEAVSAQKKQNAAAKERVKFNLSASVPFEGPEQDAYCVLAHGKVYLDHPEAVMPGYRFNGYYFNYPSEEQHRGLVSTISDDPPMLNWVFIDRDTGQLRYGGRHDTLGHLVGPWGWTEDEENLTFQGRDDVFLVVEEEVEEEDGLFTQLAVYAHPGLVGAGGLAALEEKAVHRVRLRRRTGIESKYVRDSEG